MTTDLNINQKPILIIGNSPIIGKFQYKDIIEENFFIVRFNSRVPFENILTKDEIFKGIGNKIDLYWKKRHVYNIYINNRKITINSTEIRKKYTKQYKFKMTRGIESIYTFLHIYEKLNINKPIYIHGFSFEPSIITKKYIDNVCHSLILEKKNINELIQKKKIIELINSKYVN